MADVVLLVLHTAQPLGVVVPSNSINIASVDSNAYVVPALPHHEQSGHLHGVGAELHEHPDSPLPLIPVHVAHTQENVSPRHNGGHVGPVVGQGDGQVGHMVAVGSKTEMVDTGPDPDQPPKVKSKD